MTADETRGAGQRRARPPFPLDDARAAIVRDRVIQSLRPGPPRRGFRFALRVLR